VSVSSEFQRIVSECVALLRRRRVEARGLEEALSAALVLGRADLSLGAERALAILDDPKRVPRFGSDLELAEFQRAAEHARAICHAVLGR